MGLVIKLILNSKLSSLSLCDIPLRESRLWQHLGDILAFLCVVLQVYPSKKQGKFQLNDNKILTSDAMPMSKVVSAACIAANFTQVTDVRAQVQFMVFG